MENDDGANPADSTATRWWIAYGTDGSVIHDEVPAPDEAAAQAWAQSWADEFAEGCDQVHHVEPEHPNLMAGDTSETQITDPDRRVR